MSRNCLTNIPFFFFNDTATTEIYTLSLHDALPIFQALVSYVVSGDDRLARQAIDAIDSSRIPDGITARSEEHTSELQSQSNLVCRLLLEKKKRTCDADPPSVCSMTGITYRPFVILV